MTGKNYFTGEKPEEGALLTKNASYICREKEYEMSQMQQRKKDKSGFTKGRQRYKCKDCGYNYTVELKSTAKPDWNCLCYYSCIIEMAR
ncbi:hypothetical protein Barb6XT_00447 [Bacteroidales bacterium Barb6XT]|nr:hypothetical protein Barb6XT_00447 [Bacteroidales bacterium Barb6XT]